MATEIPLYREPVETAPTDPIDRVIRYHVQTKHHFNRYARSLGHLDWANQPDPFRRFDGAELRSLPLLTPEEEPLSPSYDAIYKREGVAAKPVTLTALSRFLEYSLGLSAWKKAGDMQWALRNNPSSGNLHPTEGYLLLPQMDGVDLKAGLYHYAPKEHGIELRAAFDAEGIARLLAPFPQQSFLVGLTSIHWREAWKYGERAFRYCNHDVGHAIGTARIAAATLGWNMVLLDGVSQDTVAALLGTDRIEDFAQTEREHPDCLCLLWPAAKGQDCEIPVQVDTATVTALVSGIWHGKANKLSGEHGVHWEIIDEVAEASWKSSAEQQKAAPRRWFTNEASREAVDVGPTAGQLIRQRRSAVSFDGKTSITSGTFFRILSRLMPAAELPQLDRPMPWDVLPWKPAIHLLLFVHRVDGLIPGLYLLVRDRSMGPLLQQSMNEELVWNPVPGCPETLPLYWLLEGDAKKAAVQVSCHQEIAGDSAFSLGMIAEFEGRLREGGAWWYPRLFWEAGLVGQVLYLEAEAAGVRGTGIGCFFDDPVHEIVGMKGRSFQSLYHFTMGGPVEDGRLMTLPPYHHLKR
ncbi:MAG: SagB/ThcOx family dehydrogenase [Nitrospirota bacterium]|nr:SagB/ThcOx family dehydrogenase [Nitrospirota bacterium]MDP2384523.1 SagB/ThcOx family dehydrogenase [Nitrospirota bacterium]